MMSYLAVQRSHEIGIRIAIDASPSNVLCLVTSEGLRAAATGLAAGAAGVPDDEPSSGSVLVWVTATDPLTLFAAA
jgi:putative ABC transport system permease protein